MDAARRADELFTGDGFVDRENRGKFFHLQANGVARGFECAAIRAGQEHDRLADVVTFLDGEQFLVVEDGTERVMSRYVKMRENGDDAVHARGCAHIDRFDAAMCDRTADKVDQDLVPQRREVVDVHRLAGDVRAGRIVRVGFAELTHGVSPTANCSLGSAYST